METQKKNMEVSCQLPGVVISYTKNGEFFRLHSRLHVPKIESNK